MIYVGLNGHLRTAGYIQSGNVFSLYSHRNKTNGYANELNTSTTTTTTTAILYIYKYLIIMEEVSVCMYECNVCVLSCNLISSTTVPLIDLASRRTPRKPGVECRVIRMSGSRESRKESAPVVNRHRTGTTLPGVLLLRMALLFSLLLFFLNSICIHYFLFFRDLFLFI